MTRLRDMPVEQRYKLLVHELAVLDRNARLALRGDDPGRDADWFCGQFITWVAVLCSDEGVCDLCSELAEEETLP